MSVVKTLRDLFLGEIGELAEHERRYFEEGEIERMERNSLPKDIYVKRISIRWFSTGEALTRFFENTNRLPQVFFDMRDVRFSRQKLLKHRARLQNLSLDKYTEKLSTN